MLWPIVGAFVSGIIILLVFRYYLNRAVETAKKEMREKGLIRCICGKLISDKSESCPNCGHPTVELIVTREEGEQTPIP